MELVVLLDQVGQPRKVHNVLLRAGFRRLPERALEFPHIHYIVAKEQPRIMLFGENPTFAHTGYHGSSSRIVITEREFLQKVGVG